MLSLEIILVFAVVLFLLVSLYTEFIRPATSFFIAIVALNVFGILTPTEVLH